MKQSVPNKNVKNKMLLLIIAFCLLSNAFAQTGPNSPTVVPELVFTNPVLVSGQSNQDGAVYLFSNVASGIDATVTILGRSNTSVVLDTIDVPYTPGMGYDKAWQPQLGIQGNVPPNLNWWMRFQINFWHAGTNKKYKVPHFVATALDVDGDGLTIAEYVQMDKVDSIKYSTITKLTPKPILQFPFYGDDNENGDDGDDNQGNNSNNNSPVFNVQPNATTDNAPGIDTSATANMATASWFNTNQITVTYGATSGSYISNAGERLNSMWFKTFNMAPKIIGVLPVTLLKFNTIYQNGNVQLSWTSANEINFSHFVLERSIDGKSYQDCAVIFGAGNENGNTNYSYTDKNVSSSTGIVYYRLRLVDVSKETTYSSVHVIRLAQDQQQVIALTTYPNPVADQLKVTMPNSWQSKRVILQLYSAGGVELKNALFENADQTEVLSLHNLAKGFYIVKASCNGQVAQQHIVKN